MKGLYWIIGIIILAFIIYWLWSANANPADTNPATSDSDTSDTADDMTTDKTLTVNLGTQNNSGQSGTAVLTEINGKTQVVVNMMGTTYTSPQPAHIHVGACPNPGAATHPLTNLVAGVSTTTIDATLEDLRKQLPLAINIHKSVPETAVYTACGDLRF